MKKQGRRASKILNLHLQTKYLQAFSIPSTGPLLPKGNLSPALSAQVKIGENLANVSTSAKSNGRETQLLTIVIIIITTTVA